MAEEKKTQTYSSGAIRSGEVLRYDLLFKDMPDALRGVARRATIGAAHYGDHNWKKGGEDFNRDLFNHQVEHDLRFYEGDLDDELVLISHKEAKAWGAMADLQAEWDKLKRFDKGE